MTEVPSPGEQAAQIGDLWGAPLHKGDLWHVLSQTWWDRWARRTGFHPPTPTRKNSQTFDINDSAAATASDEMPAVDDELLGAIDNSDIADEQEPFKLRAGLSKSQIVAVDEPIWALLCEWYGAPELAFPRKVVAFGLRQRASVELFPEFHSVFVCGDDGEPVSNDVKHYGLTTQDSLQMLLDHGKNHWIQSADDDCEKESESKALVRLWKRVSLLGAEDDMDTGNPEASATTASAQNQEWKWLLVDATELKHLMKHHEFPPDQVFMIEAEQDGQWRRADPSSKDWTDFAVGDTIEALDTQAKWFRATIRDVKDDGGRILIHYNGRPAKWDKWIQTDKDKDKIAARGTHTKGDCKRKSSSSSSRYGGHRSSFNSDTAEAPIARGAVGLRNLGNTCFMNSMVQCLAATPGLAEFFVDDQYHPHINRDNPLGWQGRVAEAWAHLVKQMWSNKFSVVAPRNFKTQIAEVNPIFSGYQQHDSAELLQWLLDGLHEDLNQIKKKPYVADVDYEGQPDGELAEESWRRYLLRNKSIITDTVVGELKSHLVCPNPDCRNVSVKFDPSQFLMVPVPQKKTTQRHVKVQFHPSSSQSPSSENSQSSSSSSCRRPTKFSVSVPRQGTVGHLKAAVSKLSGVPQDNLIVGDIFNNKPYKIFQDDEGIGAIKAGDDTWVYDCPQHAQLVQWHRDEKVRIENEQNQAQEETSALSGGAGHEDDSTGKGLWETVSHTVKGVFGTSKNKAAVAPFLKVGVLNFELNDDRRYNSRPLRKLFGQPVMIVLPRDENLAVEEIRSRIRDALAPYLDTANPSEEDESPAIQDSTTTNASHLAADLGELSLSMPSDPPTFEDIEHEHAVGEGDSSSATPPPAYMGAEGEAGEPNRDEEDSKQPDVPEENGGDDGDSEGELSASEPYRIFYKSSGSSTDSYSYSSPSHPNDTELPVSGTIDTSKSTKISINLIWSARGLKRFNADAFSAPLLDGSYEASLYSKGQKSKKTPVSLAKCLQSFTSTEVLGDDDKWFCNKCKEHVCATKTMSLWRVPDVFIVQLKRFQQAGMRREKLDAFIEFPVKGLDMAPYIIADQADGKDTVYDLFAVSNHFGGLGGGHYTAYTQNLLTGKWYNNDDSRVTEVRPEQVVSPAAYVLFYQRRGAFGAD